MPSPSQRRFRILTGNPMSPLSLKRQRTVSSCQTAPSAPMFIQHTFPAPTDPLLSAMGFATPTIPSGLYTMPPDTDNDRSRSPSPTSISRSEVSRPSSPIPGSAVHNKAALRDLEVSIARLTMESHINRLAIQDKMAEGKGTKPAYARHLKNFFFFWSQDQERRAREDSSYRVVSAEPITVTKAALFLAYETSRNKVSAPFTIH